VGFKLVSKDYLIESFTTWVESVVLTESLAQLIVSQVTLVESVEVVSVEFPPPQEANATIANNAITFFIVVFFWF